MIEVNNLTTSPIDEEFLKGVARKVLEGESASRRKKEDNLSIVLVGQERMRELNKKYRKKNKVTDVLTFGNGLNEIVICLREVKKNAKKYSIALEKELTRVLIHGILHLLGYNHEGDIKEAEKMDEKQNYYLSLI